MNKTTLRIGSIALLGLLSACSEKPTQIFDSVDETTAYSVEIKRSSFGIPHITANDYGSLGYGDGYASAQDHICNIAHSILQSQGNYSKYYGAGEDNQYLIQDVAVRSLDITSNATEYLAAQPPELIEMYTGYAAGYNRYLAETGPDGIRSWCSGAEWLVPITPEQVLTRALTIAHSTSQMGALIASAAPPKILATPNQSKASQLTPTLDLYARALDGLQMKGKGSNAWAIGKDRSENGKGMLLGNPHYPWLGTNRFWEKHLVIPEQLNVYGVSLIGMPGVVIGFNEHLAWTHTVSASKRVVFYKLDLVDGDPTSYLYDGEVKQMTSQTLSIPVLADNGTIANSEHTVWFSHYGPMVSMPGLAWSADTAFTVKDANAENLGLVAQWQDMSAAQSMDEFIAAHDKWNAIPWVNTIATNPDGQAVYLDGSNAGMLSDEAIDLWQQATKDDPLTRQLFHGRRMVLLDGSDSRFEWQTHPDSRLPGVVPFSQKPQLIRSDYVFNANDSYWLSNVEAPMVGHSPLFGRVESARSPRTRMNALILSDTGPDGAYGEDGKFSIHEMQSAVLANQSLTALLLKDELVAACQAAPLVMIDEQEIDLSKACDTLANYNGHLDLESRGAVLFREWISSYDFRGALLDKGALFDIRFEAADPVNTPRGLADKTDALEKLGRAVLLLDGAGLAVDVKLADAQHAYRQGEKFAIHGGNGYEGVANLIDSRSSDVPVPQTTGARIEGSRYLTDKGYLVTGGSSFIYTLSYTEDGPVAEAIMSYSQSGDATSAHFSDQTKMFANKEWRPILFKAEDIEPNVISSIQLTQGR
ncbi:penicillin acylase family protein [Glaciecola sp. SC05]|uniref:penicillin acylase family protein n=1 Tax=Glaciecola sp. SC05 TaxID=1987355 RepID=UPI003527DBAF